MAMEMGMVRHMSHEKAWPHRCDLDEDDEKPHSAAEVSATAGHIKTTDRNIVLGYKSVMEDEIPKGPFGFVESTWFQAMTGVVIFANCIIIGVEADAHETSKVMAWVDQLLLMYFVLELCLRMCAAGYAFVESEALWGNLLDVAIVLSGVLELWLLPLLSYFFKDKDFHSQTVKLVVGAVRMLRIVRLVRLVKMVEPLYTLALGIVEAMQGMFWVLIFLVILLYAVAIVLTRLIGHGLILPLDASDEAKEIAEIFGTIPASMFALFEMMSCWSLMVFLPVFEKHPVLRILAVLFYIIVAWALLAVMTGVVSEKMLAVRQALVEDDKRRADAKFNSAANMLVDLFEKADSDGSMAISPEEFMAMLLHPETNMILLQYTSISVSDLSDLFDWMDNNDDGNLTIDEFMKSFRQLNEEFGQRSLLRMQQQLARELEGIKERMTMRIQESFERFFRAVRDPLRKLVVVTEQIQRLDLLAASLVGRLRDLRKSKIFRADVAAVEARLSGQIEELAEGVERLARLQEQGLICVVRTA